MGSLNQVVLVGFLGRDAELKYTGGGSAVAGFSLATTETWSDKSGQRHEKTQWHKVVLWGKQAETLAEYLVKGKQIAVLGRIQYSEYVDRHGHTCKGTDIRADRIVLLGGAPRVDDTRHVRDEDVGHGEPATTLSEPLTDEDIPF